MHTYLIPSNLNEALIELDTQLEEKPRYRV